MNQSKMLNYILGCASKVEILRILIEDDDAMTGRRIASIGKISPRACQLSLDSLVKNRILFRKAIGRAYAYTLNREHRMVWDMLRQVFEHERSLGKEAAALILKVIKPQGPAVLSVFWNLVHSRKGETLHFLLVIEKKKDFPEKETLKQIVDALATSYGFQAEGEILAQSEFAAKFGKDSARRRFEKEFERIKGLSAEELLDGTKKDAKE